MERMHIHDGNDSAGYAISRGLCIYLLVGVVVLRMAFCIRNTFKHNL